MTTSLCFMAQATSTEHLLLFEAGRVAAGKDARTVPLREHEDLPHCLGATVHGNTSI